MPEDDRVFTFKLPVMSKFNKRAQSALKNTEQKFFKNNPIAFANYNLQVNLLEGGSVENLSDYGLKVALNEENILNYPLLLAQLLNRSYISAN